MFRNQYDSDTTTFSPQGRLHQLEYAKESIKQGSCVVALKSKTHVVITALKRAAHELSSHQRKVFRIDDHVGVGIAGLTSDARVLCTFMRDECLTSRFVFDEPMPVSRLVGAVGDKMRTPTMQYGRRPFGVGFLVCGYDEKGPHIYQTCPTSNVYECKAMSIGARYQSAKTYLERSVDQFNDCSKEELIQHGLKALHESLSGDTTLTTKNCTVAIVGEGTSFTIIEDDDLTEYMTQDDGQAMQD